MTSDDPTAAVVAAWLAALKAAGLQAYDEVHPERPREPYFAPTSVQVIPEDDECLAGSEVFVEFSGWSRDARLGGEVAMIGQAARQALAPGLTVAGFRVVVQELEGPIYTRDPESGYARARMTLRLEVEAAD